MTIRIIFFVICLIFISLIVMKCNETYQTKKYKSSHQTDSVLKAVDSIYVIVKDKEQKVQTLKEEIVKKQEKEKELLACAEKQKSLIKKLEKKPTNYFEVVNQTASPSGYGSGSSDGAVGSGYSSEPPPNRLRYENEMLKRKVSILKSDNEELMKQILKRDSIISLMRH